MIDNYRVKREVKKILKALPFFPQCMDTVGKVNSYVKTRQNSKDLIVEENKDYVWAFNAGQSGNDFRGNPKYLFIYINKYRPDITAYWLSGSEETTEFVRKLGYRAYTLGTLEAEFSINKTGVFVAEQVKLAIPKGLGNAKYLNLYHGVGAKDVERVLLTGGLAEGLAHKYILHNKYYRNNQLFLCPSPMMEEDFRRMCGIDENKVVRAGYPRNIYQKYFDKIETFDHDLLKQKKLSTDYSIAVYAPTYRQDLSGNTFGLAIPDIKQLIANCKRNKILFVFKMHPLMENEYDYLKIKKQYADCPYLWFWNNKDDIYEIIDKIELAIIDYSSIFTDFISAGVPHFIRYVFDYEEAVLGLNHDYMEVTTGKLCYNYSELLNALDTFRTNVLDTDCDRINDMYWKYSSKDSLNQIVDQTLAFVPDKRSFPTLFSFDVFDTLISRKGLAPESIFYKVQSAMRSAGLNFPEYFIENYVELRMFAEKDVREYYHKTLEVRHSERREIFMSDIFDKLQFVYGLTEQQKEFIMQAELEAELEDAVAVSENVDYVCRLCEKGEYVVLISDMYLPVEQVRKMLCKVNSVFETIPLFLSSEYGVQKTTKKLFLEVYKSFKPFYDFGRWIHYGDSTLPDVTMPSKLGIATNQVVKPEFDAYAKELVEAINSYDGYLVAALMARFDQKNCFDKDRFVYKYVSLCFVPYICWVLEDAIEKGYKSLYFVSRDGYFLKQIADIIINCKQFNIKTKYIYASRRAWRIPSFTEKVDEGFWLNYGNFAGVDSYAKLLKAMALDERMFLEFFPELDYIKEKQSISTKERETLVETFKNSQQYNDYLLNLAKERRVSVCGYLKQEINPNEKFAIVEYWGRGYTQESFTKLWKLIAGENQKSYFYYSRTILPSLGDNIRYNFTTNNGSQLFIEAIFANMPYKSIESYHLNNGKYEPDITPIFCDKELFESMGKYLELFAKDYLSLDTLNRKKLNRDLYDFALDYYKLHQDDVLYQNVLAPLVDSVTLYGQKREFAPAFSEFDLDRMQKKVPRLQMTRSIRLSYYRSPEPIKEKYREIYQLEEQDDPAFGKFISRERVELNRDFKHKNADLIQKQYEKQLIYDRLIEKIGVENKILLVSEEDSLNYTGFYSIRKLLNKQSIYQVKELVSIKKKNQEDILKEIASARYILSITPLEFLSKMKLRIETETIVLGEVAVWFLLRKSFLDNNKERYKYSRLLQQVQIDHIMVSSEKQIPILAEIFDVRTKNAFEIKGNCRTDLYFDETFCKASKEKLIRIFPETAKKKVLFYMPLSRVRTKSSKYKDFLDLDRLKQLIGDQYVVITDIRTNGREYMQPINIPGFAKNISNNMYLTEAICAADVIVGDYRDTFFEATLTNKPIFVTSYDRDQYLQNKKTLFSKDDIGIGPVIQCAEDLAEDLKAIDQYDFTPAQLFREKYLSYCDGLAAQRLYQYMIKDRTI